MAEKNDSLKSHFCHDFFLLSTPFFYSIVMSSPVLSYKKPSGAKSRGTSSPQPNSPSLALPNSPPSKPNSPRIESSGAHAGRKVLSRRRALQDFYNIQQQEQDQKQQQEAAPESPKKNGNKLKLDLADPEQLQKFVQESSIKDILKLRNSITNDLNSHDLARKSIIYDNYYELIKLNQVLGDLTRTKTVVEPDSSSKALESLKIYTLSELAPKQTISDDYIENIFADLTMFVDEETSLYNKSFKEIVEDFQQDAMETESSSSVKPIVQEAVKFPSSVDKTQLVKEINVLLGNDSIKRDPELSQNYLDHIQKILKGLDHQKDELLILQLNELKRRFL